MVVMNKQDYMEKAKNLTEHPTYRALPSNTMHRYKAKLFNIIKRITKGIRHG